MRFYTTADQPRAGLVGNGGIGMAKDPVCGMDVDVDEATATDTAEHEGTTYYFCCKGCRLDFEDDPQKFLSAESSGGHGHS